MHRINAAAPTKAMTHIAILILPLGLN